MQHLMMISVGPVQDFIASARQCQDLWFGSWLLSDLSRAVSESIRDTNGATLIFPSALGNDDPDADDKVSVANKIIALLPEGADPTVVAKAARARLLERLCQLRDAAFARVDRSPYFQREVADAQVEELMEFLWVAVPLENGRYADARADAEKWLAARKNSRLFVQVPWLTPFGVPKSALDGQRESVIHEELFERLQRGGDDEAEAERGRLHVKSAERLCGVGLFKRLGRELALDEDATFKRRPLRPVFHSTSHVAAAPVATRLARDSSARGALEGYFAELQEVLQQDKMKRIQVASQGQVHLKHAGATATVERTFGGRRSLDGSVLQESRIEDILEEVGVADDREPNVIVRELQGKLRSALQHAGIQVPTYYAMLIADGDRMGQAIDDLARKQNGIEVHQAVCRTLNQFASDCRRIVDQHAGSLVYSGGDDVLALLPLHTALQCAQALRDGFARRLEPLVKGLPEGRRPTLSVGLAIAHHQDSLGEVRELAGQAERLAKVRRDSLAVVYEPRSGSTLRWTARWQDDAVPRLLSFIDHVSAGRISSKASHDLEEALAPLQVVIGDPAELSSVVAAVARRVFLRKREQGGEGAVAADVLNSIDPRLNNTSRSIEEVKQTADELRLAKVFAEQGFRVAWGTREEAS
jgi:CRISPR-associated protein Cmr2